MTLYMVASLSYRMKGHSFFGTNIKPFHLLMLFL